jgi:ethanolamine ammonia-lyase small subunit
MPTDLAKPLPTSARLSLGRTAAAISTNDHLQFQLDHALARDAVHAPLDVAMLTQGLQARNLHPILLRSAVEPHPNDRRTYLRRPDLGRKLHPESVQALKPGAPGLASETWDAATNVAGTRILFLLADGLSSLAVERHALHVLDATLPLLPASYFLLPPAIATSARVALADEIGHLLRADLTILLIGERPGLSSADSLGVYLTWNPRPGRTDAERNCISNIRGGQGLSHTEAAHRIAHYIAEATRLQTTGIALKDPSPNVALLQNPLP